MRKVFRNKSSGDKGLREDGRVFKKFAMRLGSGHDGCVDDEPGALLQQSEHI